MEGAPSAPACPSGADLIMSRYRPIAPRPPPPLPSPASPLKPDAGDGGGSVQLPPPLLPPSVERAIAAAASRWARKKRRGRVARPRRVPRTKKALPIRKLGPQKERSRPISEIGGSVMTEAEKWAHGSSATGVLCQDAEFLARAAANAHRPHHLDTLRSGTFTFVEMMGMAMGFPAAPPVNMSNLMPPAARAPFTGMPLVSLDVLDLENTAASCNPTVSDGESSFGLPSAASPSSASRNDCDRLAAHYPPAAAGELADEVQLSSTTMCAAMATALSGSLSDEKDLSSKLDQSDGEEDSRNFLMSLEEGSDSSHVTKIVGCTEDVEASDGNNCIIEPVTLSLFPTSCKVASSHSAGLKHAAIEHENAQNSIHWIPLKPLALNDDLHDALPGCRSLDRIASRGKPVTIAPHFHRLTRSVVKLVSITEVHMKSAQSRHEQFQVLKQQHEGIAAPVIMTNYNTGIRIRWVNTAYKKLIGQPQCPWLMSLITASTIRDGRKRELQSPLLAGEVSMHCCVKFPNTACAFSGLVKVEWSKYGSERGFSMALPCDVTRWVCEDDGGSALFVWKLDVEACLKLTCGG